MLLNGQEVRKDLRWVVQVGQAVPHRNAAVLCKHFNVMLLEAAVFNAVIETAEHFRGIFQGFLFAHLAVGKEGDVCAFIECGDFKCAARAGGSLFKEQHDVFAFKQVVFNACALLCFEIVREIQHVTDLSGGKVL